MLQLTPVFDNLQVERFRETSSANQEITLTWMLQQNFPQTGISTVNDSPLLRVS